MTMPESWLNIDYKSAIEKISTNKIKIKQNEYLNQGNFPIIDQGQNYIGGYTNDNEKIINCNFPIIVFGDHTKVVKLINFKFAPGADGVKVVRPLSFFTPKIFFYFTKYLAKKIPDKGYSRHFQYIEKEKIPLPPINEQNRIVEKIEELFSDLDKVAEELKKTQEQLKIYRQAVLLNMYLPKENWEKKPFNECFISISPGDKKVKQKEYLLKAKIPVIDQGESLIGGYSNDNSVVQNINLPIIIFGDHSRRFKYIDFRFSVGADGTKILKANEFLCPKFAYYHCLILRYPNKGYSRHFQYLRKTFLFYPKSIDKQKNIVKMIESRFSVCDKLEETIKEGSKKIKDLRQSILKKAFEGKLVPQNPNDEPAEKLLERIKQEKENYESNNKKRKKR